MAAHVSDSLEMIAHLPISSKEAFRQVWHLESLQIARTDDGYWLRGFSPEDLNDAAVRTLPDLRFYELRDTFLYLKKNRVPERKLPSGLLWHPIQRAFDVTLPSFNNNLFEVKGSLDISFSVSSEERPISASIVRLDDLLRYIDTTPQYVYQAMYWCKFGSDHAFLYGALTLPIVSKRYWSYHTIMLPVGYDLEFPFLKRVLQQLNASKDQTIFWIFDSEQQYQGIAKEHLIPLTRSSVKYSLQQC